MLHLLPKQGYQIYKYFVSLDQKGDGEVTVEEFHKFFKLTETPFSNRVFMAVDLDGSGELDFQEFLLGMHRIKKRTVYPPSLRLIKYIHTDFTHIF